MTPPRSVDDIDSTLSNVAGSILFYRGPVTKAIDNWRKSKGPFLRDGHLQFKFRTMDFQTRFANLDDVKAWAAPGEVAYRSGLWREPAYYATIENNCTTSLPGHINEVEERPVRFSFKLLLNGYIPELAGNLPRDAPFEEVMQRYAISEKAKNAGLGPEFSEAIREGIMPFERSPEGL